MLIFVIPIYLVLPFVVNWKFLIAGHVIGFTALYRFLRRSQDATWAKHAKEIPPFKKVLKYKRQDKDKRSVLHLLLFGTVTNDVFMKILSKFYMYLDWKDLFVIRAVIIRFFISIIVSIIGAIEWALYGSKIEKQPINDSPIFILGHFRSGTTLLHTLIARNTDDFAYFTTLPLLFSTGCILLKPYEDKIAEILDREDRWVDNMPYRFKDPQEDHISISQDCGIGYSLIAVFGRCYRKMLPWLSLRKGVVPEETRDAWKASFLRMLKKVTYLEDRECKKRLVLKSPTHTARIEILLEMFPKAQFVFIHRDPFRLLVSTAKLNETFLLTNDLTGITDAELQDLFILQYKEMMKEIKRCKNMVPEGNFVQIDYEDLSKDKVGTMKSLYSKLNLSNFDKVKSFLDNSKKPYQKNKFEELDVELKQVIRDNLKEEFEYLNYTH